MSRGPSSAERALYGPDVKIESPSTAAELSDLVRGAEAEGRPVVPAGEGAHAEAADPRARAPLLVSTERLSGGMDHEPDDFTLSAPAGTRLEELRALLRRHRQEIPHDASLRAAGTIGGLVARAPFAPRQGSTSPLHALVLGVEGVRGGGKRFKAGGTVVKNVAGYQVHKLVVGSMGRLGVLTRINFRLRPIPARRVGALAGFETAEAAAAFAQTMRQRHLEPACLALLAGTDPTPPADLPWPDGDVRVAWLLEGNPPRVEWLSAEASKLVEAARPRVEAATDGDGGDTLLAWLASFEEPGESREVGIAHVATTPNRVADALAELRRRLEARGGTAFRVLADALSGVLVVRWRGPRLEAPLDDIVEVARRFQGSARLVHLPAPLRARHSRDLTPDPNAALAARLRAAFDPRGIFSSEAATRSDSTAAPAGTS